MGLFKNEISENKVKEFLPLAFRMAPKTLEEFIGQKHILGEGKLLRRAIDSDRVGSVIFFGPSGTGKTALAKIIANKTKSEFIQLNAVTAGVKDIREVVDSAEMMLKHHLKKTTVLIDEIHHFNRTQQDALLPYVEMGTINMIGTTTENPYFYVNSALLSRSTVFEFKALEEEEDIRTILKRAISDRESGFGNYRIKIDESALQHIIRYSNGDARKALNALEVAVLTVKPDKDGVIYINVATSREAIQSRGVVYDKKGDKHYDHISAFIKSLRGSDPDAALYWLAKMLSAGEDPRFIIRRVIIAASEDVGNADPNALVISVSALQAIEFIGLPEAKIPLAQAAIYVACAPKSNAVISAIDRAMKEVEDSKHREVPEHLKDANIDSEKLGHGKGYIYPHDYKGHFVKQEYFPDGVVFYNPSEEGYERIIKRRLENWKKIKNTLEKNLSEKETVCQKKKEGKQTL